MSISQSHIPCRAKNNVSKKDFVSRIMQYVEKATRKSENSKGCIINIKPVSGTQFTGLNSRMQPFDTIATETGTFVFQLMGVEFLVVSFDGENLSYVVNVEKLKKVLR